MAMDNTVTLVGNLTRDPELRYSTSGRGVASFGLAVNRRWQSNGEWQEAVSFHNVVAWADLGENCAASLTKGMRAVVTGRLEQRSYDNKDGQKVNVTEIIADDIAPSLRWAQAQVERIERDKAPSGGSGGGGSVRPSSDPIYGDEEPFVMLADEASIEAVSRR